MMDAAYDAMRQMDGISGYAARHGIEAEPILTVETDAQADAIAERLRPRIEGRVVVEIGGGHGLLAMHLSRYARRVFCIEANPLWATSFVAAFYGVKPANLSYLFGASSEFEGAIRGDVALFCSHSGIASMHAAAAAMAPTVIDVYGEMIAENPHAFDAAARRLRAET